MKNEEEFSELIRIITILRGENGCPWDRKQTPLSIKKYLVEECRELVEALESEDTQEVCDEIGDMYFILTMISVMYSESGSFKPTDPFRRINEKMIRRHPHVFAGVQYESEEELRNQWERIKKEEKAARSFPED